MIPSVEIGSHFSVLVEQFGSNYSVESLLAKHTIYPFYAPFLSKNRQKELLHDVQGDGKRTLYKTWDGRRRYFVKKTGFVIVQNVLQ